MSVGNVLLLSGSFFGYKAFHKPLHGFTIEPIIESSPSTKLSFPVVSSKKLRSVAVFAAALAAVCLAYSNHFQNGFHFDDFHTVTDNQYIRDLRNLPKFFIDVSTFSVLPANRTYRPVVSTALALDYHFGSGYKPGWFQLSTFLCFLVQLVAIYFLFVAVVNSVRRETRNRFVALFATAWYGLHPANAETVNYIIQRGDVYSTLGAVAGLALYAYFPKWRKSGVYLLPVVFGVLSKPPALVFPVLLLLYILFFEEGANQRRFAAAFRKTVPAFAICALLLWLLAAMTPKSYVPSLLSAYSYRITQPFVWMRYFGSFFLPLHLSADSDLEAFSSVNSKALAGFAFVIALTILAWITARRSLLKPISYGLFWFIFALLPTSAYPLSEVENDHRMFFPFVGLVLAVSWAGALVIQAWFPRDCTPVLRRAVPLLCASLLAAYGFGVWRRNQVWHSDESLWRDVAFKSPHNGRGLMNYALTQMEKGNCPVALRYLDQASIYTPSYPTLEVNLGIANDCIGRPAIAEEHFHRAIALAPSDYQTHFFYGRSLYERGELREAAQELAAAVALNPNWEQSSALLRQVSATLNAAKSGTGSANAGQPLAPAAQSADYWINASLHQYQTQQYRECILSAREALKHKPSSFEAYNNIGAAYGALSLWDLAIANERQSLRINPNFVIAQNNLRWYTQQKANVKPPNSPEDLLTISLHDHQAGLYRESIKAAQSALRLRPNYPEAYNNIAAAYEAMGDWDQAVAAAQQALRLKPDYQLAKNNLAWSLQQKGASAAKRGTL